MSEETLRCFVGVPIGEPLARELREAVPAVRAAASADGDTMRWVAPRAWHLTLAFLGATPGGAVPGLIGAIARVGSDHAPFAIATGGLGAFPSRRDVRVLWYGLADRSRRLAELAVAVRAAVGSETSSPFRAHLTLARARGDRGVMLPEALWRVPVPHSDLVVDELILYRSLLARGPASYEMLASVPLAVTRAGSRGVG